MIMTTAELICMAILTIGMPNAEYACKHMDSIVKYSDEHNIDPAVLTALIYIESRWSPKAKSRSGACGLTQIIPKWSRKFGYVSCRQLQKNPELAIKKGAQILSHWIYRYGRGDVSIGLCGYNSGYRCRGKNRNENKKGVRYAKLVLKMYRKIELEMIPGCMHRE
jgi:soluble lytic murein transglycosylase-like protein